MTMVMTNRLDGQFVDWRSELCRYVLYATLGLNESNADIAGFRRSIYTDELPNGPGKRPNVSLNFCPWTPMNVDLMHSAFGLAFLAVWLLVGQILVGNRTL